ncbi:MAG: hypothetical protein NC416_07370 [Eubacterium sp.]|nr:hypothetical protein [Eubacterium sp.]
MLHLIYVGESDQKYVVDFSQVNKNIVQLTGDFPVKENGFTLSRIGYNDAWDYTGFRTIYRDIEGGVQFSNDESVYVAPPLPEPEPEYTPTEEEIAALFRQNKEDKINLSKILLESYLAGNPIVSAAHNNTEGVYAVTSEKQTLMMRQYMTYQLQKSVDTDAKLTWNETGKSCEDWTEQEFVQLTLEIKEYVYPLVSYQQTIEECINACTTQESLDEIVIDYASVHNKGGE